MAFTLVHFTALVTLALLTPTVHGDVCGCKYSAFTALATSVQLSNSGSVVVFDEMITNVGNDFDLATNTFTCRIAGVYSFSWSIRRGNDNTRPDVELQMNDQAVARVYLLNEQDGEQNSNTIVLELDKNDVVKLVMITYDGAQGRLYNDDRRYSTFTGYLLYKDE